MSESDLFKINKNLNYEGMNYSSIKIIMVWIPSTDVYLLRKQLALPSVQKPELEETVPRSLRP